ncbi:esterase-like activity of phytase family protein [Pedomonas sp. V897]|uniref:esterase-like activity of phytase family protein n=1 Tax=Pedomonas sp. V897 TaxID=3446482 RepID=UPI003EE2F977
MSAPPARKRRARLAASLLALAALGGVWLAAPGLSAPEPAAPLAITVRAAPVPLDTSDPARRAVGALQYRGGLHVTSEAAGFGGYSGLRLLPDGRLLAVSDRGHWLAARPVETGGRLTGLTDATLGPLLDEAGQPLAAPAYDAEALEVVPEADGLAFLVAFERDHRIWRYALPAASVEAGQSPEPETDMLAALRRPPRRVTGWLDDWPGPLPANGGIEAMAVSGTGAALLLAEDTSQGRMRLGSDAPWVPVTYRNVPGFKPTDAVFLPAEGRPLALVLSRHFSLMHGVAAVLELVDLDRVEDGVLAGVTLARLAPPLSVDNMEAVAAARRAGGWDIYLMADDNRIPLQRTLLLKFFLPETAVP